MKTVDLKFILIEERVEMLGFVSEGYNVCLHLVLHLLDFQLLVVLIVLLFSLFLHV